MTRPTTRQPQPPGRLQRALTRAGALAVTLCSAAAATAQQAAPLRPPAPREDPEAPVIMTVITLAVLVIATLFAATFPSKRGHQD